MLMIKKLGFVINVEKSQFEPTTKLKILGFFMDSVKMEVSLTNDKKVRLLILLVKLQVFCKNK